MKLFDVEQVLSDLTTEEKVLLLQAKDDWHLNGVERLGIPELLITDGPSGVRLMTAPGEEAIYTTTMPTESILSASWDPDLIEEVGKTLGKESRYFHVAVLLGPGVNAKRSPLAGRNFEYYSEDPYLSGKLASAMIRGVQSQGVGTSLKHYVANDQETRRFSMNAVVDERTLREICLKPFEMAVREAKPWTIMGAYPRVNGTYVCENSYLLEDILRKEYGYEGVTLSDWGAAWHKTESHANGLDLETGSYESYEEMLAAVKEGKITPACLDTHVRRVLTLIRKAMENEEPVELDWEAQHAVAKKAAEESIVLLKNEGRVLPLNPGCRLVVAGLLAEEPHISGGGSSSTAPRIMEMPLENMEKYAQLSYCKGYSGMTEDKELISEACAEAKNADAVIVFTGTLPGMDSEGSDRKDMKLPESQICLVRALAETGKPVIAVNASGAAVEFAEIESSTNAILHCGLAGEGQGSAIADILFGRVNPSGKLTETFPVCLENTPAYPFFPGEEDEVLYREEIFVGYRYYDMKKVPTAYPFGHGLSYSTFEYSNMQVSSGEITKEDTLKVYVDITNTSETDGTEIVQIYISDPVSYLLRPVKELKAFRRVSLKAGETKTVEFTLDKEAFSYYVPHIGRYAVESGEFVILAGASSQDIRLKQTIVVHSDDEVRKPLTPENTLGEFYRDDRYAENTKAVFEQMGMTQDSPAYPMLVGARLKDLPRFLDYMGVPRQVSMQMQQQILGEC